MESIHYCYIIVYKKIQSNSIFLMYHNLHYIYAKKGGIT